MSVDGKYLYFTTGGAEPEVRLCICRPADRDHYKPDGPSLGGGPGGRGYSNQRRAGCSPVFTRDIGTQEIYALTVKWP